MSIDERWFKDTVFDVPLERRGTYAAELDAFEKHKDILIASLRKVHGGGSNSKPLDEEETWRALVRAAVWVFKRQKEKHEVVRSARRVERLADLEKALDRTHKLIKRAMKDAVGFDLLRGWCAEVGLSHADVQAVDSIEQFPFFEAMKQLIDGLATLKAAADRAAFGVHRKPGPLIGTGLLSIEDLSALCRVYQRSTGQYAILGPGYFAEFVEEFLNALNLSDKTTKDYVIELFKSARKQLRKRTAYPHSSGSANSQPRD